MSEGLKGHSQPAAVRLIDGTFVFLQVNMFNTGVFIEESLPCWMSI
ncbi:hypothetical protein J2W36_001075 [Variovorax ginsengisoli]|uniref:Uncharacterized protein n=1 Tax=Variovorax ginsengisoli TaxID=363844 RepID=A0ABT9S4Z2_9BURK|nr:hypothetical protein [Variovorax ginsengisoli]